MTFTVRMLTVIEDIMGWLGNLCLAILMVAVTADVCGRYFLNAPISGVYEISETYLMVAIVFLGLAQAQRHGAHVRVLFLFEQLPASLQKIMEMIYLLAAAAVFGAIAVMAATNGIHNIVLGRWTTGVVAIPTGPSWLIVAAGAGVLALQLLIDVALTVTGARKPGEETLG